MPQIIKGINIKSNMNEELKVIYISPEVVKAYQKNAKKHSEKQITQIINSIKEFRFNNPILIDENNELIAGHGRLQAAKHLKIEQIPAICLSHLTPAQKKAYRIADNKLTENGDWDIDLLTLELKEISNLDLNLNLDITGFDNQEIDVLFNPPQQADSNLNKIPEVINPVSKLGDVWNLGKHRIVCGDSIKKDTYDKLMNGNKANMIFTDPPYNVKIDGHVCGKGSVKHEEFAMASGEMSQDEFVGFLTQNFTLLKEYSKEGSLHYICMDWRHVGEMSIAGKVYDEFKNICVWNKTNAGMGSLYRSKHEFVFLYKNGKEAHINNVELGSHGRYRTNVWDYAGINTCKNRKLLKLHPTVKPVELIWDAILDASNRGDIVLDSFLGSGSTLIACEKAHRVCYGIELSPKYVDTAIRRWEEISGGEAIRGDGKKYDDLVAEQEAEKNEK